MLGPTHHPTWRRGLLMVAVLFCLAIAPVIFLSDRGNLAARLVGSIFLVLILLIMSSQIALRTVPGAKRLQSENPNNEQVVGPSRKEWVIMSAIAAASGLIGGGLLPF